MGNTISKQAMSMNTTMSGNNDMDKLLGQNTNAENVLKFGVYEYDVISGKNKWSDGVYNIFTNITPREPLSYTAFMSYVLDEDLALLDEDVKRKLLSLQQYNEEYRIAIGNKNYKFIQLIGRRIHDEQGNVITDNGIIRDITSEKQKEEAANIAINELLHSNKELESFAYIASHDLQEPVRKISTFSSRLVSKLSAAADEETAMYLKRILASTENMRLLIDNLLEYSRMQRNVEPFAETNLNFILQQVKTDLELVIEETGTVINSDKLPNIIASSTRMKQLFNNIISNSIKFAKQGEPSVITISYTELSDTEREEHRLKDMTCYYKIVFSDNGIGFEEEYSQKIFHVFQRLNGKSEYPGSGIGLAICKKIVEQHHGIIYATGRLGEGANIVIILPQEQ